MSIFLGFRQSVIANSKRGENVGQDVLMLQLGKGDGKRERLVVDGKADEIDVGPVRCRKIVKPRHRKCFGNLTCAVSAKIEKDYRIATLYGRNRFAGFAGYHNRLDELVGNASFVRGLYGRDRVNRSLAFGVYQQSISALGSFPTLVAIHRVIASDDRGYPAAADLSDLSL